MRQAELDKADIYTAAHIETFKAARFKTAQDLQDPDKRSEQHKSEALNANEDPSGRTPPRSW